MAVSLDHFNSLLELHHIVTLSHILLRMEKGALEAKETGAFKTYSLCFASTIGCIAPATAIITFHILYYHHRHLIIN
jgi:hypothetical protein